MGIKKATKTLDRYKKAAQWVCRSRDPFISYNEILYASAAFCASPDDDAWTEFLICSTDHFRRIYSTLKLKIPGFTTIMAELEGHGDKLEQLSCLMNKYASTARSSDCGSLKESGLTYVALDLANKQLTPAIPARSLKSLYRGFNHLALARLLCPVTALDQFDKDPTATIEKLLNGRISVTAHDFPAFLYPEGKFNPENMDAGLFQGPLLIRTYRHLFTSPTSTSAPLDKPAPGKTKPNQAKLNGLVSVTPETIAYAALHTRWFLCGCTDWRSDDGVFNKEDFYNAICDLFSEGNEGEVSDVQDTTWGEKTLVWWDSQIFPTLQPQHVNDPNAASSFSTILQQRRARNLLDDTSPTPSSEALVSLPRPLPFHRNLASSATPSRSQSPELPEDPRPAVVPALSIALPSKTRRKRKTIFELPTPLSTLAAFPDNGDTASSSSVALDVAFIPIENILLSTREAQKCCALDFDNENLSDLTPEASPIKKKPRPQPKKKRATTPANHRRSGRRT